MNRSSITKEYRRNHIGTGRSITPHTPSAAIKKSEGYLGCRGNSTEEWGVPPLHQVPQLRVPVPGREDPIATGCENQWRLCLRQRTSGVPGAPLKVPMHEFICWMIHSLWALALARSSKSSTDIKGRTEMSGFRARARLAAFSQTEVLADDTVAWLNFPPIQPVGAGRSKVWISINLTYIHLPHHSDSLRLFPTQLLTLLTLKAISRRFSIQMTCLGSCHKVS